MIESERIISIEGSDSEASVITEFQAPLFPQMQRYRYHLKASGNTWLICRVDRQCPACHGKGDEGCVACKGKLWIGA
jgi:hypothetical protein